MSVQLERAGPVFVLRMKAGENRLDGALLQELSRALDEVEASQGDGALVTTGEGKFYSNGLDLEGLAAGGAEQARALLDALHRLLARLLAFPRATVAAINGHAFAAGALLALAHDFRIMRSDRGYVCFPEIDLRTGRPLTPAMYALLQARLAPAIAHEALITGARYDAGAALARGIVHEAQAEGAVLSRAVALAEGLAGKDGATMAAIKRGLFAAALEALSQPLPEQFLR